MKRVSEISDDDGSNVMDKAKGRSVGEATMAVLGVSVGDW